MVPNIFAKMQRSGVPSAMEGLVSSAITLGEFRSVQGSALIASRPARRATADGYAGLRRPDSSRSSYFPAVGSSEGGCNELSIRRRDMNFILVNGRTPRPQSVCALCCEPIGARYLREVGTRLLYCDHNCYADHCRTAVMVLENHARASWTGLAQPSDRAMGLGGSEHRVVDHT
jgi:hypothetical protein